MILNRYLKRFFYVIIFLLIFSYPVCAKDEVDVKSICEYLADAPDNLPLVLGIPGFRVPGFSTPQSGHFGELKEILAESGIPFYCIIYDSDEHPLTKEADLSSESLSIASTRVIPSIVRIIKLEGERRKKEGLPPVKDVIMVMYSQGTVVSYGFVRRMHYFKRHFQHFAESFGPEHAALGNDPIFISYLEAVNDFNLINKIKVQREEDFNNDIDLRNFYERAVEKMNRKYELFEQYLIDPKLVYPDVEKFDPIDTDKYPKKYEKVREFALKAKEDPEQLNMVHQYMRDYAMFRDIMDLNFMYFSISGSIFGSPQANSGYGLLQNFPVGQLVVQGMNQIKDTRLGSFHHTQKIKHLVRESKLPGYPITKENTLFIVGANGEKGDDFVDQPSAHLSAHGYVDIDLTKDNPVTNGNRQNMYKVKMDVLPEMNVVPLRLRHFPVKTLWGLGPTLTGSAHFEEDHPVLPYLAAFMFKDFTTIDNLIKVNDNYMRQFMLEFTFSHITNDAETDEQIEKRRNNLFIGGLIPQFINELEVKIKNRPACVDLQGKYFNADNLTYVIIGCYEDSIFYMGKPEIKHVDFEIRARGFEPLTLNLPIKPGKILFVNVRLQKEQ